MLDRLLRCLNLQKIKTANSSFSYRDEFQEATKFTEHEQFSLDSEIGGQFAFEEVTEAVSEAANGLSEQFGAYRGMGQDIYMSLGGDCGNIHFLLLQFLKKYYPQLPANLTIGGISIGDAMSFQFSRNSFKQWVTEGPPPIFDCHAWVTIGHDVIVDATIGTYINTRLKNVKAFGGIVYGKVGSLQYMPLVGGKDSKPTQTSELKHQSVVVGCQAFRKCVPVRTNYQ